MRLTIQLSAIDNMSKVVQGAARRSLRSVNTLAGRSKQVGQEARGRMFDTAVMAAGGIAALSYPLKMASNYERLKVSMVALTQDATKGLEAYRNTIRLAAETPLQLEEVAQNTVRMIGYGQSAAQASKSIKMLGDITALTNGDIGNAIVAYGQARQEGKMLTRDLRQFINAGVPIISILKQQLGANADIFDMASKGVITFDLLEDALRKSTETGGQFADGLLILSKTGSGLWVRFADEVARFAAVFGDAALPTLKKWGETLIPIISSTADFIKKHEWLAAAVMITVGAFTALAVAGLILNGIIWVLATGFGGFTVAANAASFAAFWVKFQFYLLNLSIKGLAFNLGFAGKAVMAFSWQLIAMAAKGIWAAITGIYSLIASLVSLTATIFSIPIVGWILAIIAAIIALGAAVYYNWEAIKNYFISVGEGFAALVTKARNWGRDFIVAMRDGLVASVPLLAGVLGVISYAIDGAMDFFGMDTSSSSPSSASAVKGAVSNRSSNNSLANVSADFSSPTRTAAVPSSGGGGGDISISYNPTTHFAGAEGQETQADVAAMLSEQKEAVAKMVKDANRKRDRRSYKDNA